MVNDPVAVALSVARVLEAGELRYLVGGSLASSLSGEPRSTLDVDIVVAMTTGDVSRIAEALLPEFDVNEMAVLEPFTNDRASTSSIEPARSRSTSRPGRVAA